MKVIKILQVNTVSGIGSTGRNVIELGHKIEEVGFESYIAYGQGTSYGKNHFKIGGFLENHIHNLFSRVFGKQGYMTKSGTRKLIKFIEEIEPSIIHLGNLHGNYLNIEIFFQYLSKKNIPIVWSIHDCWAYTGKCAHYTEIGCYKWQIVCNKCPQVQKYPPSLFFDKSKVMFKDKKRLFTGVKNMVIVPVSDWLCNELKFSYFNKYPIKRIYNWIDLETFNLKAEKCYNSYKIDKNKFIILGVSAGWSKSDIKMQDFIKLEKLISQYSNEFQIVLLGEQKEKGCIPKTFIHIPYVENKRHLASIYASADVYVHLATEDTFGKVIAESMACGTPAIAYDSTVYPEVVKEGCGYIAKKRDVFDVFEKIKLIEKNGKEKYSNECFKLVSESYNYNKNSLEFIELYKSLL